MDIVINSIVSLGGFAASVGVFVAICALESESI